jgi:hypothetical protein
LKNCIKIVFLLFFKIGIPKIKVRVEFATRLFGTCPDMCPEKERYMRQYQRQLTRFEVDTDSLVNKTQNKRRFHYKNVFIFVLFFRK